jgi:hypothetical protein
MILRKRKKASRLQSNRRIYEHLVKDLECSADGSCTTRVIRKLKSLSFFAWHNHPGCFADARVENVGLEAGRSLPQYDLQQLTGKNRDAVQKFRAEKDLPKILFVATSVWEIGGHGRQLLHWIKGVSSAKKLLVVTGQTGEHVWDETIRVCRDTCTEVVFLGGISDLECAQILTSIQNISDVTICVTNPDDPATLLAFARDGGSPVVFSNHAHFWFGLGTSVADVCISNLSGFQEHAKTYRFGRQHIHAVIHRCLQLEIIQPEQKKLTAAELGLPEGMTILFSAGTKTKYLSTAHYDFFRTARKILDAIPDVFLIVAGIENPRRFPSLGPLLNHPRFRLYGYRDLRPLYLAADIFLESFPVSSLGAVRESVQHGGACPFFMYGREASLFSSRAIREFESCREYYTRTEEEYIHKLKDLVNDSKGKRSRIVDEIVNYMQHYYDGIPNLEEELKGIKAQETHRISRPVTTKWDDSEYSQILAEASWPMRDALMELQGISARCFLRILRDAVFYRDLSLRAGLGILASRLDRSLTNRLKR